MRESSKGIRIPLSLVGEVRGLVSRHKALQGRAGVPKRERGSALPTAPAGEYVPPVDDVVRQPIVAPPAKACGCGGRGGVSAPYRAPSRRHVVSCPFYDMKEE